MWFIKNNGRLPQSMTVDKAYLGLPGFENTGGEYQDTTLKPIFGWVFYLLPFCISLYLLIWRQHHTELIIHLGIVDTEIT
jgi:hypothetical protein